MGQVTDADSAKAEKRTGWNPLQKWKIEEPKLKVPPVSATTISATEEPSSMYDLIKRYGRPRDYTAEINRAARLRRVGVLSDILGLSSNLTQAISGRRLFSPLTSNTAEADDNLFKLKTLQKAENYKYGDMLLNARMKDIASSKAASAKAADDKRDTLKFMMELKEKGRKNDADIAKNKFDEAYKLEKLNLAEKALRMRAAIEASKDKYVSFFGKGGSKTTVKAEDAKGLASYLYGRMKEVISANPNDARTLDDVRIALGEGGDEPSKTLAVVMRKIQQFPELQNEVNAILSGKYNPNEIVEGKYPGGLIKYYGIEGGKNEKNKGPVKHIPYNAEGQNNKK